MPFKSLFQMQDYHSPQNAEACQAQLVQAAIKHISFLGGLNFILLSVGGFSIYTTGA